MNKTFVQSLLRFSLIGIFSLCLSIPAFGRNLDVQVKTLDVSKTPDQQQYTKVNSEPSAIVVDYLNLLACDGIWKFSASQKKHTITVQLKDENQSLQRSSCAQLFHYELRIFTSPGTYDVKFKGPKAYGASIPSQKVKVEF